jgi:tetratricopeptide (TPR) repeat protein
MRRLTAPLLAASLALSGTALLGLAVVIPAEAQQAGGWRKDVADKVKAGQEAGQAGNFREAIRLLQEAKAKGPLQPAEEQGVNELLIWAASSSKDYKLLAATIEERLATGRVRGNDRVQKLNLLSSTYYTMGDLRKTVSTTESLIQARGSATADDLILLGQAQFQLKNYQAAAQTLEQAYPAARRAGKPVAIQAKILETLNASYFELKDEDKRVETLHKLMLVQPKAAVFEQLVSQYQRSSSNDPVAMVNLYRLGARSNVLARDHMARYADVALDVSSPGEAVTMLERGFSSGAIKKDERNQRLLADAKQQLAGLKAGLDQQEREARAIAAGEPDARLALAFYTTGNYAKAVEAARRSLEKGRAARPDDVNMLLGVSLMELKRNKEAQAAFQAAAANPRVAGVANLWSSIAGG